MKQWALWLPLLLAPIDGAWAINKCTNKDGTVAFQDAPCPREAETKEIALAGKDRSDTCKRLAEQAEALLKPQVDTLRELSEDFEFRQKYRLYFDRGGVAARSTVIDTQAIKEMLSESTASAASTPAKTLQPKKNDIRS